MIKKILAAVALSSVAAAASAGPVLINEGFNNVAGLQGAGWVFTNISQQPGTPYLQGNADIFAAHSGPANSFISGSYMNAVPGDNGEPAILNNWLITPEFSTAGHSIVSFWLRAEDAPGFADNVSWGFSSTGSDPASFTLTPSIVVPVGGWTKYTFNIASAGIGSTGRFAINYNGLADTSDYFGLDDLQVAVIPEPASVMLMGLGLAGLVASRRRKRA